MCLRRAAAPDPRRAHQPSRHRQPRGPGRGDQRIPGRGHRSSATTATWSSWSPTACGWSPTAGCRPYDGDLDDYRRLLLETSAEPAVAEPARPDRRPAGERRALLAPLRQRAKEAEREIERLDQERANSRPRLADPASYGNGTDIGALQKRLAELKAVTEEAEHRWLEAEAEIEQVAG